MKKLISLLLALLMALSCSVSALALQQGDKGSQVTWHQKSLNFLDFYCGEADSIYGSKTVKATKAFQKANNLTADGIAGSKTLSKEKAIIKDIQSKLNALGYGNLSVDGLPGSKTVSALKAFQRAYNLKQTGVCDKATYNALNKAYSNRSSSAKSSIDDFEDYCLDNWTLPVKSFKSITGSRAFGSSRSNGRVHAGIDFVAKAGTPVYAMSDGVVSGAYLFYEGTYAVEVKNSDGSVLRYCEISPSVKVGDRVNQGQKIGTIKRANGGTEMLHLELYLGTVSGQLTQRSNKTFKYVDAANYQRRADLLDPTFLKYCEQP